MLVTDLLHSCANDRVAAAAVYSIGGEFALKVQSHADRDGITVGAFAARVVKDFALRASEREWRDLVTAVRGTDLPVLSGLQTIIERRTTTARYVGREAVHGFRSAAWAADAA